MAGNQEFNPNLEEEQSQNASFPPAQPEAENLPPRSLFQSKILEVRSSAQAQLQKINILLGNGTSEVTETGHAVEEDPRSIIETLAKTKEITPSEYLQRSRLALRGSTRLQEQITAENDALEQTIREKDNRQQINEKLEEMDKARGLKRLSVLFKKRRLTRQHTGIQEELDAIGSQVQAKKEQITQLHEQASPVREKQEQLILGEITQAVQRVKTEYEGLLTEIIEDGTLTGEIRNTYIQQVIAPKVAEIVRDGELPQSTQEDFYKALENNIKQRNSSPEVWQASKDALQSSFIYGRGFIEVRELCEKLINREDEHCVSSMVAALAAEDLSTIKAVAESHFKGWESRGNFSAAFEQAISPVERFSRSRDQNSFGAYVLTALSRSRGGPYPDMRFWQAVKDSPAVNREFGDMIRKRDQEYYRTALDDSLSDRKGDAIDILRYYPTPDAIRNLVMLASADYKNYRTAHANRALSDLAERPDWSALLEEAEKVYPSLASARKLLHVWNFSAPEQNPDILDAVGDFAWEIYDKKGVDQRLRAMALEAMPNVHLLTLLVRRGVLTEQERNTLKDSEAFIKQLPNPYDPLISGKALSDGLRENLFSLIAKEPGEIDEQQLAVIKRYESLSQAILANRTNNIALAYLTNKSVVERISNVSFQAETLSDLLQAYKTCNGIVLNEFTLDVSYLQEFCRQFEGRQTVTFFNEMFAAYQNQDKLRNRIITLVGDGVLTKERALALPVRAQAILDSPKFDLAITFPQLFLDTDDGLEFFNTAITSGLFSLDKGLDVRIGNRFNILQRDGKLLNSKLLSGIAPEELIKINTLLTSEKPLEANQQNWQQLLMGYVTLEGEGFGLDYLSPAATDRLQELFKDPKVRDLCLNEMRNSWINYLKSGKPHELPFSIHMMSEFIDYCGGAGPLSQITSLNSIMSGVNKAFSRETTIERTKNEIMQGMVKMEDRFARGKWSNEDRTDFYNISRDIILAAPSLFSDYLTLFDKFSPSQMKVFAKEIYPLYRTKLVLTEKEVKKNQPVHERDQLVQTRKDIRNFTDVFNTKEHAFDEQKLKILAEISGLFKERFGIIKTPQEFSPEHIRSVINISTYLANLNDRTAVKETILGFYLSMMINDRWDAFRRNEAIDPKEYMTPEKSVVINKLLTERKSLNPLNPDLLGISEEEMPEFMRLLQQETQNLVVGNIETIDVKLMNIILNLRGLEDLDLYPDKIDKQRMQLLLNWGNKKVGSVVARMYQSLTVPGKAIQFSEEDTKIRQQITQSIDQLGLTLSPQVLKEHFQDGIKPLATVDNLLSFIKDSRAESEVDSIRELLKPSEDVIQVFSRLGEDFKPTSGAMALSQDLSYLDNLIVKREDELTPEEKTLLTEYTTRIRAQMVILEEIYGQIKNKFSGFKQSNAGQKNPLLQDKLAEIDRIVNAQSTQQVITSASTNNLNTIIENIRECLSCKSAGSNNDTDLTFGDSNKFYLYSHSETQQQGSIADQIAFVEPITRADGSRSMAFVLDRLYGTNTPTILENQIDVVLKKYQVIKERFPDIRLSIFVTGAAITTAGTSLEMLREKFEQKNVLAEGEIIRVDVAESAMGDHYIEFGGSVRENGVRAVNGLMLSL